ncbi:MAG: phosphatase PAP2 family protein [Spirochaetes bacterium]|nr:phosphatase PAP2 family protein [Spirochaetota bacterium]
MDLIAQCPRLFDEGIINLLHPAAGPLLDGVMKGLTLLGNPFFYIIVLALLYWCVDKKTAILVGIVFFFSVVMNALAKVLFETPRPNPEKLNEPIRRLFERHAPRSPGFPSGHAQNVTAFWGGLIYFTRSRAAWLAGVPLMVLVPYSRIYLGVHFPGDILGGYCLALVSLAIAIPATSLGRLRCSLPGLPAALAAMAIPWLVYPLLPDLFLLRILSFCSGCAAGIILSGEINDFDSRNRFHIQGIKTLIGLGGLGMIMLAFSPLPKMVPLHYARFLLSGFWITWGAPLIFNRIPALAHGSNSPPATPPAERSF